MYRYVFFIGGSGARVYMSLLHSAAAGILKSDAISVMLIDADKGNYANTTSINLYKEYRKVYDVFKSVDREVFTCNIEMESENVLSPVRSDAINLNLAIGNSSPDRRRILKCLYTREEIGQNLKGGFYAHPNIGCVFFSNFESEEFTRCLDSIARHLDEDAEVRIALVGSIFGGTGAAGIPTIHKLIKRRFQNNTTSEKLKIGGVFIEPYFTVNGEKANDNKNISIIMDDFYFNTYEALAYYKTNQNMNFDSIYLVGQQTLDIVNNEYCDSGHKQNNKAHMVELFASLAIDSFFNSADGKGVFGSVCKDRIGWNSFPNVTEEGARQNSAMGLADFARAQAIYMAEICEYVERIRGTYRERLNVRVPQWYKVYHMCDGGEELEILKSYSVLFMEWLYMINSTYDTAGILRLDDRLKLFGGLLEDAYEVSKEMSTQPGKNMNAHLNNLREHFNTFVDTASNVEYVMEKVLLIMSSAGVAPWGAVSAGVGAVGLFFRIFSLVSGKKEK